MEHSRFLDNSPDIYNNYYIKISVNPIIPIPIRIRYWYSHISYSVPPNYNARFQLIKITNVNNTGTQPFNKLKFLKLQ